MQAIDNRRSGKWPQRVRSAAALALGLLAATTLRSAFEPGIVFEYSADAKRTIVSPDRLEHYLQRGDRVRVFERSGSDYELIIIEPGGGPASNLSGFYQATITGNTRTLNLRNRNVLVSLEQSGARLSGTFDRGRGKIWGDIDGDRIRFEWFAAGGNGGRGEWQIMPNGRELRGSWYSDWHGDGAWNLRRSETSAIDRTAAAIVGERLPDRVQIEVPLDAVERIRLISTASDSTALERVAQDDAGGGFPELSRPPQGDASDASTDAANETVTDLWAGIGPGETAVEIGALVFLGADFSVYHRPAGSPWLVGFRYVETKDDFIAIDFDDSDTEKITIAGPFARYLYSPGSNESFYLGGGLFRMSQEVECALGSDEDSATSLFVGGGLMSGANRPIGYNVGFLVAPGLSLGTDTGDCSSETDGGFDVNASVVFRFN